jgi:hypothetical protein
MRERRTRGKAGERGANNRGRLKGTATRWPACPPPPAPPSIRPGAVLGNPLLPVEKRVGRTLVSSTDSHRPHARAMASRTLPSHFPTCVDSSLDNAQR